MRPFSLERLMRSFGRIHDALFCEVFSRKKLSKHYIKEISIVSFVFKLRAEDVSVIVGGISVLGLAKILLRRFKYLLEECEEVVHVIHMKARDKALKPLSVKKITLGLEFENPCIDDNMIDPREFVILPAVDMEDGMHDGVIAAEGTSFNSFNEMSGIEQTRFESTDISKVSIGDMTQISVIESGKKKRRIILDEKLEFDHKEFKRNLENVKDTLFEKSNIDMEREFSPRLKIPFEILDWIKCALRSRRESIEKVRDVTSMEFDTRLDFKSDMEISTVFDDICVENPFDVTDLPKIFVFNKVFENSTKFDKARSFFHLLCLLEWGTVIARQGVPYSDIKCEVV